MSLLKSTGSIRGLGGIKSITPPHFSCFKQHQSDLHIPPSVLHIHVPMSQLSFTNESVDLVRQTSVTKI